MSGETGSTVFGLRMRWVLTRLLPPAIGVAGLVDMLFVREAQLEPFRLFVCFGLLGFVPVAKLFDLLPGGKS